jgi:phosphoglycolate phosphatase-like HAD superfamily hydrolase
LQLWKSTCNITIPVHVLQWAVNILYHSYLQVFGAIRKGLWGANRGVALAVVTSNACDNVRHVLGADHAARIRHDACGAALFGQRGHVRRVLKRSGVRPGEAIVIGDERRDPEAARAEDIPFHAGAWGDTHVEVLQA